MSVRAPHLQDEALLECFYATRRGEAVDPPSAEHLADCAACSSRFSELGTFLAGLSEDADADVSALFPPERLRAQQSEIARRLELVGRAARVITFPGRASAQATTPMSSTVTATTPQASQNHGSPVAGVFTLTRSGQTAGPLTVNFSLGGTATNGVYTANATTSITFSGTDTTTNVIITPVSDNTPRLTNTVVDWDVDLSGPGEQIQVSANTLHVALAIPEAEAEQRVREGRLEP